METHMMPEVDGAAEQDLEASARYIEDFDWVGMLRSSGAQYQRAVRELHTLALKASRLKLTRMPEAAQLGSVRTEEIAQASANDAVVTILDKLDTFEGRSKFTTWAYKFALFSTSTTLRREVWKHREVDLDSIGEPRSLATDPVEHVEHSALRESIRANIECCLSKRQREVLLATAVHQIPIDVVAERLGSTRNAVYKTLHDARKNLRALLTSDGVLAGPSIGSEA